MLKLLTALAMALGAPTLAFAATDGTLGDSSSGIADITFNVTDAPAPSIQVTRMTDLERTITSDLVTNGGSRSRVCVYMSLPGTFSATITATPFVPYSATRSDGYSAILSDRQNNGRSLTANVIDETVIVSRDGLRRSGTPNCPAINSSGWITIYPNSPDDPVATPRTTGSSTATITITVSPD